MTHHDGCFGCGRANLFGLQLEDGRFFVKQDHQGPPGQAHPGILATALIEVLGADRVELSFLRPAPVGTFVHIEVAEGRATARVDGQVVAEAVDCAPS